MRDNLAFIDEIIDRDEVPSNMTLHQYLTRTTKYRSRCKRYFGSVEKALRSYGYYSEYAINWADSFHQKQLAQCLNIDADYQPYFEGEAYSLFKSDGNEIHWTSDLRKLRDELILEKYTTEFKWYELDTYMRKDGVKQHPVDRAIRNIYETWENFYKTVGHRLNIADSKLRVFSKLGYEFERLVSEVLSEISAGPIESQATQPDGSRPDFVINGSAWVDAKLSRSTTFNPQCKTLDKYASQADTLTIIYAIKDTKQADSRAEFIYVLSLLPLLSPELQQKVREFVSKAQVQRIGG